MSQRAAADLEPCVASARVRPTSYPGPLIAHSALVTAEEQWLIRTGSPDPWGWWPMLDGPHHRLDEALDALGEARVAERAAVLAPGSVASPPQHRHHAQLMHFSPVVPLVKVAVSGVAVGHAAHVSMYGYVPFTIRVQPHARTRMTLALLDEHQLMAMDAARSRFHRVLLRSADGFDVVCGQYRLSAVYAYVSKDGYLAEPSGQALPASGQEDLVSRLSAHEGVRALLGQDADSAARHSRAGGPGWLAEVRRAMRQAQLVRRDEAADMMECHKSRHTLYMGDSEGWPSRADL